MFIVWGPFNSNTNVYYCIIKFSIKIAQVKLFLKVFDDQILTVFKSFNNLLNEMIYILIYLMHYQLKDSSYMKTGLHYTYTKNLSIVIQIVFLFLIRFDLEMVLSTQSYLVP